MDTLSNENNYGGFSNQTNFSDVVNVNNLTIFNNLTNFSHLSNFSPILDSARIFRIKHMIGLTIACLGLIANVLNIAAVAHVPQSRSPHSKLITSLSISDIGIALQQILEGSVYFMRYYSACFGYIIPNVLLPFALLATLLNLFALGIDHYIAM